MKTSTTRRRLGLAALLTVLALTFTACGADGGDDAGSTTTTTGTTATTAADDTTTTDSAETTTTESGETTTTESGSDGVSGMAKDMIVSTYKKMGMSDEQAECAADYLVDKMGDMGDLSGDTSGLMDMGKEMFKKCDIDPSDLKMSMGN